MKTKKTKAGFSLVELMIALALSIFLTTGVVLSFLHHLRVYNTGVRHAETSKNSSMGNFKLVYGTTQPSLREASSSSVSISVLTNAWTLTYGLVGQYDVTNAGVASVELSTSFYSYVYSGELGTIYDANNDIIIDNLLDSTVSKSGNELTLAMTTLVENQGIMTTNYMKTAVVFRN